ncbi:hypothetical protein U9M48_034591, partial [Paspalum notatum var. saurae]
MRRTAAGRLQASGRGAARLSRGAAKALKITESAEAQVPTRGTWDIGNVVVDFLDIWVYFSDLTAKKFLFVLGFVKFNDKAAAWDGETRRSKDLMRLIHKFCDDKIDLFVQSADLQAVITKKLNVKCSYDPSVADELVWGLKNILHGVLREEKDNITREYCLPMSKGLQRFLQDNLINVSQQWDPETMTFRRTLLKTPSGFAIFDVSEELFESQMDREMVYYLGRLEYLEDTSRLVRTCFEKEFGHRVSQIGELVQDNLVYAQVTALILVPDSQHEFDLFKLLSVNLAEKVVEAKNIAASEEAINKKTKKKTGKMAVQNVEKTAPE